jgi:uncharacterized protein with HEPN domain
MVDEDRTRILHMLDAAGSVARFVDGRQREDLDADEMLRFALVRAIEVFGEAAAKISAETRDANPEVPWRAIVGMRNRLIHAYFDIDTQLLWVAATREIPTLLPALEALAKEAGSRP